MTIRRYVVASVLCLSSMVLDVRPAAAELRLVFGPTSSTTVDVNDVFDVSIHLEEYNTPAFTPQGIKTFGFNAVFGPELALETFPGSTAFQFAAPFASSQTFTPTANGFTVSAEADPTDNAVRTDFILLGTVRLKALAAGTSTLTLGDPDPSFFDQGFTTGSGGGIDANVFFGNPPTHTFTVNVAAVPEPGSMSLVGLAAGGLWLARRRKRLRAK